MYKLLAITNRKLCNKDFLEQIKKICTLNNNKELYTLNNNKELCTTENKEHYSLNNCNIKQDGLNNNTKKTTMLKDTNKVVSFVSIVLWQTATSTIPSSSQTISVMPSAFSCHQMTIRVGLKGLPKPGTHQVWGMQQICRTSLN